MTERYFYKFPKTTYNNALCTDITKRVTILDVYNNDPTNYHKMTIVNSIRPDHIADQYYNDPMFDWLVYLGNGIIDPYYGWYLDTDDFNKYIVKKYGSIEQAQKKIKHYQIDWTTDDREISVEYYNNNLPNALKKYYTPVFSDNTRILNYVRNEDDKIVVTNKIIDLGISNAQFTVGEIIDIKANLVSPAIGGGEVVFANTTFVKIKNVSGNTASGNYIVGETSNAASLITSSNPTPGAESLSDDEYDFWAPVYYYEWELEQNEQNKNIRLIDSKYAIEIAEKVRVALKS